MDLFEKLQKDRGPLGRLSKVAQGYFMFPKLEGEIGSRMKFMNRERIVWSLNNYLGLANHPEVRKADAEGAQEWGLAYPMGARMMSGESDLHLKLEKELAAFAGKDDAMLLNFGYQGMISIIDSILGRHDVVVYDSESHACIVDGLRMHPGKRFVFAHNDMESFEKMLNHATDVVEKTKGGILVITEGVFGMAGDMGSLKEICTYKDKYKFRLLVDDAHGFGTMGKTGAGTGEEQGVQDQIDIYFSTFAKSMASIGAFVAANSDVIEFLKYNMRSQIFAKSLPMPLVIGNLKRLELLRTKPELKNRLWEVVNKLQSGLKKLGLNIGKTNSPVTPVYLQAGLQETANLVFDIRENYGIFCSVVLYPVIPKGQVMLRLIPTAAHTDKDVEDTLNAFEAISEKLKDGTYSKVKYVDVEALAGGSLAVI